MQYVAPVWLPGGHAQTIWPALYARRTRSASHGKIQYRRERWIAPDGDFIDLDWLDNASADTLLVLFHGLEGSSRSHYALAFAALARSQHSNFVVPHFRGCSGELNLAPRAYHSGDFEEIDWVLRRLRSRHSGRLLAVGVSLGGNALLRWAEELGHQAAGIVDAVVSISAPVDLTASGRAIGSGFNRQVYTRMFLASMKPKAMQKLMQFPGLFSARSLLAVRDLYEFDNVFTAPLHGFGNTVDYWRKASARPHLAQIKVPALLINALNDPFVPAGSLPKASEVGGFVSLWQPHHGGHVGFAQGWPPGHLRTLPDIVGRWFIHGELNDG
jgi:predicted alpha/beta-fold hydrolase